MTRIKLGIVTLNTITYGLYKGVDFRYGEQSVMLLLVLALLQCWSYTFAHAPELERGAVSVKGRIVCDAKRGGGIRGLNYSDVILYMKRPVVDDAILSVRTDVDGSFALKANASMGLNGKQFYIYVKLWNIIGDAANCNLKDQKSIESLSTLPDPLFKFEDVGIAMVKDKICEIQRGFPVPISSTLKYNTSTEEEGFVGPADVKVFDFGDINIGEALESCANAMFRTVKKQENEKSDNN